MEQIRQIRSINVPLGGATVRALAGLERVSKSRARHRNILQQVVPGDQQHRLNISGQTLTLMNCNDVWGKDRIKVSLAFRLRVSEMTQ